MKTTHDLIIEALQKYFVANQLWETKGTHTSARALRKQLSEIRRLALRRRAEVQEARPPKGVPRGNNIGKYNSDLKASKEGDE